MPLVSNGLFINAYEYSDDRQVDYYINDYIASLDQYDQSSVRIYTPNGYYEYVGTQFNYTLQEKSFTVNADTVYRQLYIDGNFVMDSTRYAVASGAVTQIGTEIEAKIINIDPEKKRISLGIKQMEKDPIEDYKEGDTIKGKIIEVKDKNVLVEVNKNVKGLIPQRMLAKGSDNLQDNYKTGEEIELKVVDIDREKRRVILADKME